MAFKVQIGDLDIKIKAEPITPEAFRPFGDVVSNPRPNVHPADFDAHANTLPPNAFSANQGTAIQYRNVSRLKNLYGQAPSGRGDPIMSVFVCAARGGHGGESPSAQGDGRSLTVQYLERHPYTAQTFTPLKSTASTYLVIVAPNLPPSSQDEHLPVPSGDDLPGRGLPDLKALRAFVVANNQAVTYGVGTWHAPMVVLGKSGTTLDFVVSQFSSGVAIEDCQLLEFVSSGSENPKIEVLLSPAQHIQKL